MITYSPSDPSTVRYRETIHVSGQVTDKAEYAISIPVQIANGESFTRRMAVQKGDHKTALPWKWDSGECTNDIDSKIVIYEKVVNHYYGRPWVTNETWTKIDLSDILVVQPEHTAIVTGIAADDKTRLQSEAILKAQANLRKNVASIPMLFLERKATLTTLKKYSRFVLNNAITMQRKDVKKWLAALRRKTPKNRLKALANDIANTHLEFVFGVQPVVEEMIESYKHFSKPRVDVRSGRGRSRLIIERDFTSTFEKLGHKFSLVTTIRDDYSVRTDLRCSIRSHVANDLSLLGFNPLYVLYDNHPLSFIIGWFSNFNTWLASLDPLVGLDYDTGSSSIMRTRTIKRKVYLKKKKPDVTQGVNHITSTVHVVSGVHSATSVDFKRDVHPTIPGIQSLRLTDKTSFFTHAASVSLLIQRMVNETTTQVHKKPFVLQGRRRPNKYLPPINYR